jgi:hypothetical protein
MYARSDRQMKTLTLWDCDYGRFEIPPDVPTGQFRKDGWFDHRRKLTPQLRAYFEAMSERMRDGKPILTWARFQKLR